MDFMQKVLCFWDEGSNGRADMPLGKGGKADVSVGIPHTWAVQVSSRGVLRELELPAQARGPLLLPRAWPLTHVHTKQSPSQPGQVGTRWPWTKLFIFAKHTIRHTKSTMPPVTWYLHIGDSQGQGDMAPACSDISRLLGVSKDEVSTSFGKGRDWVPSSI